MKKALSLFLAILMIFSVLSVCSYAEDTIEPEGATPSDGSTASIQQMLIDAGKMSAEDCTLVFYIDGGTYKAYQRVFNYETQVFEPKSPEEMVNYEPYVKFPEQPGDQKPGRSIQLPLVKGAAGWDFNGWYCVDTNTPYAAGYGFEIPAGWEGKVLTFRAMYIPAEVEENTFAKVFDILAKIFGTIIGLIAYEGDTAVGIAFVRKIFGGITG